MWARRRISSPHGGRTEMFSDANICGARRPGPATRLRRNRVATGGYTAAHSPEYALPGSTLARDPDPTRIGTLVADP
jgi:hypothetical protein